MLARLDVEMRFRLVEQQHVGIAQQACGEPDELALPAGEDAGRLAEVVVVEADLREQRPRAALEARAAGGGPALDDLFLAPQQTRQLRHVGALLGELRLDLGEVVLELVEVGARRAQRLQRVAVVALELLRQEREHEPAALS